MMKLSDLLQKISPLETRGSLTIDINGVNMDSRLVEKGNLFVAVKEIGRASCRERV